VSAYERLLPTLFPHSIIMDSVNVPRLAGLLASPDDRHLNGSSFAVTADTPPPNLRVWLTDASFRRVRSDPVFGIRLRRLTCD